MAGSLNNPVLLDPFQAITEVGWPSRIPYIAISTQLAGFTSAHPDESWSTFCTTETSTTITFAQIQLIIEGPGLSETSIVYHPNAVSAPHVISKFAWLVPSPGFPHWDSFAAADAVVTGMPDVNETASVEPWTYPSADHGWQMTPASGSWDPSFVGTSLPDNPEAFNSGLSPAHVMSARAYLESPACYRSPLPNNVNKYGSAVSDAANIATVNMDLSGVSVALGSKTYTPVSTALITNDGSAPYLGSQSVLWILCAPTVGSA